MNRIDSPGNETIKKYASLKEKKYRAAHGMYLLEGARIVKDALLLLPEGIEAVFVREDKQEFLKELGLTTGHGDVVPDHLCYLAVCGQVLRPRDPRPRDPNCYIVSEKAFKLLSDTETPQGIIAAARIPKNADMKAGDRGLLLDGISDAGNLGTLIRSAAGFGYKNIYLINCADPYAPKTVRSTMGGILRVNICECGHEIAAELKKQGVQLIAADMGGADAKVFRPAGKFVLMVGSEARGLSEQIKDAADATVALKQHDIESLNAAVAGSILMYLYS